MTPTRFVHATLAAAVLAALVASAACGKDSPPPMPSPVLRADPGGPYQIQHNTNVVFSGTRSTSTPNAIAEYRWNCGQTVALNCDATGPTPTFNYRRCGGVNRPACRTGSTTIADYTVTLTIRDTAGNTNTATTTVTVTNNY